MSRRFDIREYKRGLRARCRSARRGIDPLIKAEKDKKILEHILSMPEYLECETMLCYVSKPEEADTRALIEAALSDGKRVAVPRTEGDGLMNFYPIKSVKELVRGAFGVLEPPETPETGPELYQNVPAICVTPGLGFDRYGYRLGYGGGYYDRFFSKGFGGKAIGICYSCCILPELRHGKLDVQCDYIVTENGCAARETRD